MIYAKLILEWIKGFITWFLSLFKQRAQFNINGYRIRQVNIIGQGGYGFIYRVQDLERTNKFYALKKMICQSQESKFNFENEVKMLEISGKHENVVQVLGVHRIERHDEIEGYILMELGDKTLLNYLIETEHKRMTEKQVIQMTIMICKGLQHLHSKGIAHRDFKVQNILLMNGIPKICDFGSGSIQRVNLANVSKSLLYKYQQTFQKYSTMMYRPPQMIDLYLKYQVNQKVDIWMLGCILYVMNFYVHPFQQSGKLAIINAQYKFPDDSKVSQKMKDLIRILLTPNPNVRPSISTVLKILQSWNELQSIPLNKVAKGMKDNQRHLRQGNYDQLKFQYNDAKAAAADQFSQFQ